VKNIHVETSYNFSLITKVNLPEGKTEEDIDQIDVKYSTIIVLFKDGTQIEQDEIDLDDNIDWKRPDRIVSYYNDSEGFADFERRIDK